jgi:hypothetical protein
MLSTGHLPIMQDYLTTVIFKGHNLQNMKGPEIMASQHTDDASDPEKVTTQHHENYNQDGGVGFETDENSLPPGYFKSSFFLGSMTAIGLGLFAGVAGFGYAAPILGIINADIGPVRLPRAYAFVRFDANVVRRTGP